METDSSFKNSDILQIAKDGPSSVFKLFLNNLKYYNYDINNTDEEGNSLLHYAIIRGHYQITSKILEIKPKLDVPNCEGKTPVLLACNLKNSEILELLIKKGAPINKNSLEEIIRGKKTKIIDLLVDKFKKDPLFCDVIVHVCATVNSLEVALKFFDNITDINCKIEDRLTLTQKAVIFCDLNFVKFLVQKEADLRVVDNFKRNLLHLCVNHGSDYELLEYLLQKGVDVNGRDREGETPLHYVISKSSPVSMFFDLLIKNGAFFNAQDSDGYTPLHVASTHSKTGIIETLLKLKAKGDSKACNGETPFTLAVRYGNLEAVKILIDQINWKTFSVNRLNLSEYCKLYGTEEISKFIDDNYVKKKYSKFDKPPISGKFLKNLPSKK